MKMALVPTKDDCIWYGVGYIAARAGAVSSPDDIPFHGPAREDWMVNSYQSGVVLGLLVKENKAPVPEFEDEQDRIAIVLVMAGILNPSALATLLSRMCDAQGFSPYVMRDGRSEALNRKIREYNGESETPTPEGMPPELKKALKLLEQKLGVKAKVIKVSPQEAERMENEGVDVNTDDDDEPPILN